MKLQEYQSKAARTMNQKLAVNEQLAVLALGVVGEFGEVLELVISKNIDIKKIEEELGDVNWYIANYYTVIGEEWKEPAYLETVQLDYRDSRSIATQAMVVAAKLGDSVKKTVGQGHPLDMIRVTTSLELLTYYINKIAEFFNLSSETVREKNIAKLMKRFPDGFEAEKSINR